ncbi:NADAR family protein [Sansalvadorimonas sp. 2012CJ34-2]|uniref:NADAR family protein n=1 Tax=Parendozoicomonas callyspongiae TaxID=2942213 RepID=A0ABT0PHP0_9GAMM|nr:NADAR family protein [Sansalvadorimonas sp. 2012CJ34-2]MCL6270521.1 NADAR family protein [Sansalvadorimonas sp. 2012CJ34-2]
MGPESRINGRHWRSVQEDIGRNPKDYIIQNNGNQKWLETRSGLVVWREGTQKYNLVRTCNPSKKNDVKHCLDLVDDLPEATCKLLLERKITPHGTTTSLYRPPNPASTPTSPAPTPSSSPSMVPVDEKTDEGDETVITPPSATYSTTSDSPPNEKETGRQWFDAYINPSKLLPGSRWSLDAIHKLSEQQFEDEHDFIEAMFPNPEPGQYHNPQMPLLSAPMADVVNSSDALKEQALKNLDRVLEHMGISRDGETFQVVPNAWEKTDRWLPPPNGKDDDHIKLRITRTLIFLHECGLPHAEGLHQLLQTEREANGWPRVDYWDEALGKGSIQSHPAPGIIGVPGTSSSKLPLPPTAAPGKPPVPKRTPPVRRTGLDLTRPTTGRTPGAPENNSIALNPNPNHKPSQSHCSYTIPAFDRNGQLIHLKVQDNNYDQVREFLEKSPNHPYAQKLNDKNGVGSENGAIRFYDNAYDRRHRLNNEYLTNTHRHFQGTTLVPLTFPGDPNQYHSVEQYFQSRKFIDGAKQGASKHLLKTAWLDVMSSNNGKEASERGREQKYSDLIDFDKWNQVKQGIMYRAILHKFQQNAELRQKLIATWPNVIIEDTSEQQEHIDDYWGSGIGDVGSNITGQILGQVREELMANPQP